MGGVVNNIFVSQKYKNSKSLAFSLIELSIVLIIIGLLVAGITGGKSLIESARSRAFLNEISGYKRSIYIFYEKFNRLPGDLDGDGKISQTYTSSSFPAPYDGSDSRFEIPSTNSGIWVDLYLNDLLDFQPIKIDRQYSKMLPEYHFFNRYITSPSAQTTYFDTAEKVGNWIRLHRKSPYGPDNYSPVRYFKDLDEKIDDGVHNTGNIRTHCYGSSGDAGTNTYDDALNIGKGCRCMDFNVDIY